MSSIVRDIVEMASGTEGSVDNLLRKALVASSRLGASDIKEWINLELNGYGENNIPDYRMVSATSIQALNPVTRRLIPLAGLPINVEESLRKINIVESISTLEDICSKKDSIIPYSFSCEAEKKLMNMMDFPATPFRIIPAHKIRSIITVVKNKILEWGLRLEESGVIGEDSLFSRNEIDRSKNITINIKASGGSQVSVLTENSAQKIKKTLSSTKLDELKAVIDSIKQDIEKLKSEKKEAISSQLTKGLDELECELDKEIPDKNKIKGVIQRVIENAAGGVLSGIVAPLLPFIT